MKYSLPSLTCSLLLLASGPLAAADAPPADRHVAAKTAGQSLVAEAASRLTLQPAIAARIRQQVHLFGQELVGSGSYQQLLSHGQPLVRLELKLQVDDRLTTLQQINDGVVLWMRRDEDGGKTVSYVNLRRLREAARGAIKTASGAAPAETLALGGLPQLLQGLARNFQFGPALEGTLGAVPVWVVQGQWTRERLAELLPDQRERIAAGQPPATDRLPPHLPDRVTVTLGRDEFIPLFPYRIEYGRAAPASPPGALGERGAGEGKAESPVATIVRMEFFEVRRDGNLDPQAFQYQPGDEPIDDQTDLYLGRLGLPPK